jgi:methanogen homocitrate synthase
MNNKQWNTDKWWVSPFNYSEEVTSKFNLPKSVAIHDATLRDGEQTPGIVLTKENKIEIAKLLDSVGIDRIEAGMPAVSLEDKNAVKEIVNLGLNAKIFTFARAKKEDIDMAVECGADGVIIEIPMGRPKLQYQFAKWSDDDIIEISVDVIKYAKSQGLEVVYFGYDTTRADEDFMFRLYDKVINEGKPDSIGIVDTMGCILPSAMFNLVKKLKSTFDVKIEVHTHNDYGMGVATSLAAVEAGAEVIHVCVNGLGERTGNAAVEPIIVALKTLYGIDVPYNIDRLKEVSDKVEEITRFRKAVNQPFVGKNVYVRESGIGIDLVMNTPLAMFAVAPNLTGNVAGVVLGKKSGAKSIDVELERLEMKNEYTLEQKKEILLEIKNFAIKNRKILNEEEFKAIISAYDSKLENN